MKKIRLPRDPQFDWFDACPLCACPKLRVWEVAARGYSVHPVRVRCGDCGLVFSNPQGSAARLEHFYNHVYFTGDGGKGDYFTEDSARELRTRAGHELAKIEKHLPAKGTVLDVGCAAGYFLLEARARGWKVEGVEISAAAAAPARKNGLKVHVGAMEDLKLGRRYQAVHAAHTLEHVKDPVAFLKILRGLCATDGRLYLEQPNAHQAWTALPRLLARLRGRTPELLHAKEHTFDFDRRTLALALRKAGWEPLEVYVEDYYKGPFRLWRKPGENPIKAFARLAFVGISRLLRLQRRWGAHTVAIAKPA
jgi:SAM-dependent methyltransferase